jgi:hypothetical protein
MVRRVAGGCDCATAMPAPLQAPPERERRAPTPGPGPDRRRRVGARPHGGVRLDAGDVGKAEPREPLTEKQLHPCRGSMRPGRSPTEMRAPSAAALRKPMAPSAF